MVVSVVAVPIWKGISNPDSSHGFLHSRSFPCSVTKGREEIHGIFLFRYLFELSGQEASSQMDQWLEWEATELQVRLSASCSFLFAWLLSWPEAPCVVFRWLEDTSGYTDERWCSLRPEMQFLSHCSTWRPGVKVLLCSLPELGCGCDFMVCLVSFSLLWCRRSTCQCCRQRGRKRQKPWKDPLGSWSKAWAKNLLLSSQRYAGFPLKRGLKILIVILVLWLFYWFWLALICICQ